MSIEQQDYTKEKSPDQWNKYFQRPFSEINLEVVDEFDDEEREVRKLEGSEELMIDGKKFKIVKEETEAKIDMEWRGENSYNDRSYIEIYNEQDEKIISGRVEMIEDFNEPGKVPLVKTLIKKEDPGFMKGTTFAREFYIKLLEEIQGLAEKYDQEVAHRIIKDSKLPLEKWLKVFQPIIEHFGYQKVEENFQSSRSHGHEWEKVYTPEHMEDLDI